MTEFELDPAAMSAAFKELDQHMRDLASYQAVAADLYRALPDGHSPIAPQMRKAYKDRADFDGGVQAVLQDYLDELADIRDSIAMSSATYSELDQGAAADVTAAGNGLLPGTGSQA